MTAADRSRSLPNAPARRSGRRSPCPARASRGRVRRVSTSRSRAAGDVRDLRRQHQPQRYHAPADRVREGAARGQGREQRQGRARPRRAVRRDRPVAAAVRPGDSGAPVHRSDPAGVDEPPDLLAGREPRGVLRQRRLRSPRAGGHLRPGGLARSGVPPPPPEGHGARRRRQPGGRGAGPLRRPAGARMVLGRVAPAPAARSGRRPGGVDAGRGRGSPHRPSPRDGQHHGHLLQAAGVGESRPLRAGRRGAGVGPGGSANRRARPHHALERGAAHPLRARRVLPVSPRVRADPARRRGDRLRAPRRALQRPPRPGHRRAVRPRRLHRGPAGRAHRHRRLVSIPEPGLPDPAGRGRRLAVLRSDAPGRRADLRAGRWSVHDRLVARRVPPWTGLRDQRPVPRAAPSTASRWARS